VIAPPNPLPITIASNRGLIRLSVAVRSKIRALVGGAIGV
jgi:hypothetical protein